MRDLLLTIGGRVADLPATTKGLVRLTQARAALADLDSRIGEFSWALSLPATRNNARIFGVEALHPLGLDKFAAIDYAYELRCEGEIFAGTFRLTSLKNGYTGQLLGAGFSWALLLGEKKLPDLRFAEVPYDGSQLLDILALDCEGTDVQFPLLSFGNFFHPPLQQQQADGSFEEVPSPAAAVLDYPMSVDDYPPGVYLRNVLRQIFKEIGWSLAGRVLDEAQWRQTVLTCAGADVPAAWPWGALLPASADNGGAIQSSFSYFEGGPTSGGDRYTNNALAFGEPNDGEIFFLPVPVPNVVAAPTRALNAALPEFIAPRNGTYTFAYSATVSDGHAVIQDALLAYDSPAGAGFRAVVLALSVRRGGEGFNDAGICYAGVITPGQEWLYGVHRLDPATRTEGVARGTYAGTASVYLEAGDTVNPTLFARRRLLDGDGEAIITRREFVVLFSAASFACTGYSDDNGVSRTMLQPAAFLPPLSQKEVVKAFLEKTCSVAVTDFGRRTVHLLSRDELRAASGLEPINLSAIVDPDTVDTTPTLGAGIGSLVFKGPNSEDPLLATDYDTVRIAVGPASGEKTVTTLFAPVAFRNYRLSNGITAPIPTFTSQDGLDQARSEVEWDISSEAPRLVRYTGSHPTLSIPFGTGSIPFATSAWDGALAWKGISGAVATYYQNTIQCALRGHVVKCTANLTPNIYAKLSAGGNVYLFGAPYTLESINNFDIADPGNQTEINLLRTLP